MSLLHIALEQECRRRHDRASHDLAVEAILDNVRIVLKDKEEAAQDDILNDVLERLKRAQQA